MKHKKKRPIPPPPPMMMMDPDDGGMPPPPPEDMMMSSMVELNDPRYLEAHALAQQLQREISEDGYVLLKNRGTLPLNKNKNGEYRLNIFGVRGKAFFKQKICKGYGVVLNDELMDYYSKYKNSDTTYTGSGWDEENQEYARQYRATSGMFGDMGYLKQEPYIGNDVYNEDGSIHVAQIPQDILERAKKFSDTAVVVIYRHAGEGADHEKGAELLAEGEASMLSFCCTNFQQVIVVLATNNAIDGVWLERDTENHYYKYTYGGGVYSNNIGTEVLADYDSRVELKYLDEEGNPSPHRYPIRADKIGGCIYTCDSPGDKGDEALIRILIGEVNPSGRLTDEIVFDYDDNPVSLCSGGLVFSRASTTEDIYAYGHSFVAYREGVYLGYKYFETFCPDKVVYPFGYGLSYTSFTWEAGKLQAEYNEYGELRFTVAVKVTNAGKYAGKDVVEMYVTAPYYETGRYNVEKALVSLTAYAKTGVIAPGASETVSISWNARDIASYSDAAECYVLESGTYRFNLATNANTAHSAPSEVLIWQMSEDTSVALNNGMHDYVRWDTNGEAVLFTADEVTGTPYRNLFTGSEEEGYTFDAKGTEAENIVYIHRIDRDGIPTVAEGTYPKYPTKNELTRETNQVLDLQTRGLESYYEMDGVERYLFDEDTEIPTTNAVYYDADGKQRNFMLQDVYRFLNDKESKDYHNPTALKGKTGIVVQTWNTETDEKVWSYFLDQLSVNEMMTRFYHCGFEIPSLHEYGIPKTYSADGPGRIGANNKAEMGATTKYSDLILACTWNSDLLYRFGLALAKEVAASGINGTSYFYAPGSNMHRSCLSGKNNNYYSEDAWLAGTSCGYFLKGLEEGGVNGCLKHFACNDQEISREGLVVFSNEQALREVYFAAFEHAIKIGNGKGIMTSLGRVGTVNACGNTHLTIDLLRKEWGFDGMVITDGYGVTSYMYDINVLIGANSGLLCFGMSGNFGECLDFMELYRYYLSYPGRITTALRNFMKGCMSSLFSSHTFLDLYRDYDYYKSEDAEVSTDINWFDAEVGVGYSYFQNSKPEYKGVKLFEGESNPPGGMKPNTNSKDRSGTLVTGDYGLKPEELSVKAGELLTVPVALQKSAGMSAFGFSILFDTSVFTPEGIDLDGSIIDTGTYKYEYEVTKTGVNISFRTTGKVYSAPCGNLFNLKLRAAGNAPGGIYGISLLPIIDANGGLTGSFYDKQGHEMSFTLTSQKDKYHMDTSGWSGVYQSGLESSWWGNESMDKESVDDLADITLLSNSITVVAR